MDSIAATAKYNGALFLAMLLGLLLIVAGFTGRTAATMGAIVTPHDLVTTPAA